jgi:hypothetical protein
VRAQGAPDPAALRAAEELASVISKDTIQQLAAQLTTQVWPQITQTLRAKQTYNPPAFLLLKSRLARVFIFSRRSVFQPASNAGERGDVLGARCLHTCLALISLRFRDRQGKLF